MKTYVTERPMLTLAGVSARTTNAREAGQDGVLPGLWQAFFSSGLASEAQSRRSCIYALYTDYESDAAGSYRALVGCEADSSLAEKEADGAVVPAGKYLVFRTERGPMHEVVPKAWAEIWSYFKSSSEIRTFTGDFEQYAAQGDGGDTEALIHIAIR
ncbi:MULTISPECIES: effector binding domain-containing protein [unclassified Paenibacillus]|uniref:GyrI-like domain-containing protein n=1 Tax=unclassified Paenibacillus TaxID=185978 RepID=UPI0009551CA1|nr:MULTISPECIES: effector binding domain-containing protein [unclassified Paenibacillus]ASS67516.1 AraC family transcriptional regulator [Paenibacillus sp. RUD330]SIQ74263.1 Predicted transcriptional regulator YdeE, contains AraC-type DNA-binding domain [Paenibacillus sp. RU4X]SIQ95694.1 Predicted transcriptional regulator YdeE, contains AraC-type DNA-binding domain [Paenibacillus sp. RU4T]